MRWRLAGIRCGRIVYSAEARTRKIARGRRTAAVPGQESFAFCPAFGFSAHAYSDVQKADMFHMSAFFLVTALRGGCAAGIGQCVLLPEGFNQPEILSARSPFTGCRANGASEMDCGAT